MPFVDPPKKFSFMTVVLKIDKSVNGLPLDLQEILPKGTEIVAASMEDEMTLLDLIESAHPHLVESARDALKKNPGNYQAAEDLFNDN